MMTKGIKKIRRTVYAAWALYMSCISIFAYNPSAQALNQASVETVTGKALPTVEVIDGIVWSQVIVGNTVYATGCFDKVNESNITPGSANVTRTNLLAYNITDGKLDTAFNHSLTSSTPKPNADPNFRCLREKNAITNLTDSPAEGRSLALSPDKRFLFVAGNFDTVDGVANYGGIAAFNLSVADRPHIKEIGQGNAGPYIASTTSWGAITQLSIAATGDKIYAAGNFKKAYDPQAKTLVDRPNLAVYDYSVPATGTPTWNLNSLYYEFHDKVIDGVTNFSVNAIALSQDQQKILVGGNFSNVIAGPGRTTYVRHSLAAFNASTGALINPWGSQENDPNIYPIQNDIQYTATVNGKQVENIAAITSISSNANYIFLTAWSSTRDQGGYEGRAAVSAVDGTFKWINDCHGDSYATVPIGNVLYSAGHAHSCAPMGAFPDKYGYPYSNAQHGLAEYIPDNDSQMTQKNGVATYGYASYQGKPRTEQFNWYPVFTAGAFEAYVGKPYVSYSKSSQAGFSVTGTQDYVAFGGEFKAVNGTPQRGLVRFGLRVNGGGTLPPLPFTDGIILGQAMADGTRTLRLPTTSDRDDATLTYRLYRDDGAWAAGSANAPLGGNNAQVPIYTYTASSRFWNTPFVDFTDTGLTADAFTSYTLVATDRTGQSVSTSNHSQFFDNTFLAPISYTGTWRTDISANQYPNYNRAFNDTLHTTFTIGDSINFRFVGEGLTMYVAKTEAGGKVDVYIDGETIPSKTIDTYVFNGFLTQEPIELAAGLPFNEHSVHLVLREGSRFSFDGYRTYSSQQFGFANNTSPDVKYEGGPWIDVKPWFDSYYGDIRYADVPGSSVSYTFYGTSIVAITSRYSDVGSADVYLDGNLVASPNMASATSPTRGTLYAANNLANTKHTIKIVKKTGIHLIIDGFIVGRAQPLSIIDYTNSRVQRSGAGWYTASQPASEGSRGCYYGQSIGYTTANNNSVSLNFTGTAIDIIGVRYPDVGELDVVIDGVARPRVNAYGTGYECQATLGSYTGLTSGNHTITVTKRSGTNMVIDAFVVR